MQSELLIQRLVEEVKAVLDSYEKRREYFDFAQVSRDEWVTKIAKQLPSGTRVLDVGAGEARYRPLFAHCDYKTQDFCQYDSTQDQTKPQDAPDWVYGEIDYVSDITEIPVDDESFDVILCTEVLEHVPEPIKAIEEMARIVKPGGRLYLSAPMQCGIHQAPYHYYGGFTPFFYKRFLPMYGVEIDRIEPYGGLFRAFQEDAQRVGNVLLSMRRNNDPNDLLEQLINLLFLVLAPHVFVKLDDQLPIHQFAPGWHVEATKRPASS